MGQGNETNPPEEEEEIEVDIDWAEVEAEEEHNADYYADLAAEFWEAQWDND